jgi:hypothetical protein
MVRLKTINYRGGVVTFSIPASWREEYEPEGGGTFYEDKPDSGTLRLNVLTFEGPSVGPSPSAIETLARPGDKERQVRPLRDGNAVARYIKSGGDQGQLLQIHYWEVANPVPPRHMRFVVFSYTILASQASDALIREELALLDRLICDAKFADKPGI